MIVFFFFLPKKKVKKMAECGLTCSSCSPYTILAISSHRHCTNVCFGVNQDFHISTDVSFVFWLFIEICKIAHNKSLALSLVSIFVCSYLVSCDFLGQEILVHIVSPLE